MNRSLKDATVKRYHYGSHEELKKHLHAFLMAYNMASRLKTLKGKSPYDFIRNLWTLEPEKITHDPNHFTVGLNIFQVPFTIRIGASLLLLLLVFSTCLHAEGPSLSDVTPDLVLPAATAGSGEPKAGSRVRMTTVGWENTSVYHTLYLPDNWANDSKLPVIVEFSGNSVPPRGIARSYGTVEDAVLGYGLTAGRDAIWVCLPFIDINGSYKQNATFWWGDIEETKRYCVATIREVCEQYRGDAKKVVLVGFSRGAIACFYIGLHDDYIASLWAGFFCHSHFDGVIEGWGYANANRASALSRLRRLGKRPVWSSQESGLPSVEQYVKESGISADNFTFIEFPYPEHTAHWVLRDIPIRAKARQWLQKIFDSSN